METIEKSNAINGLEKELGFVVSVEGVAHRIAQLLPQYLHEYDDAKGTIGGQVIPSYIAHLSFMEKLNLVKSHSGSQPGYVFTDKAKNLYKELKREGFYNK